MLLSMPLKLAAGAGGLALFAIIFGFGLFPMFLKRTIKKEMTLSSKNDVRKMWTKLPFSLDFNVYIFNFTNVEEIQNGGIPVVKEIGPYFFEEWRSKDIVSESEDDDTITYRKLDTFIFRQNLSAGLTGEEEVMVPNIILISLVTMTLRDKPGAIQLINKASTEIFDNPASIFIKVKVMDLLFRGVPINCDRKTFAAKAVCAQLKKEAEDTLIFEPNNQYKFSFLGTKNGSAASTLITVKRGMKDINDVGKVVAISNMTTQNIWKDKCNEIDGTDGTKFPPFLSTKFGITTYISDLCRPIASKFLKKTKYRGFNTIRYKASIGDMPNDPKLQCYCETPDNCFTGIMDTAKCTRAPIYVSMPHYFDTDPKFLKNVTGLYPNAEEHTILIDFEPITGSPLLAKNVIMFSIRLIKCDKMEVFKNLPDTMAPLIWIKENIALDDENLNLLQKSLYGPKKMVKVLSWMFLIFGLLGAGAGSVYHFKNQPNAVKQISAQDSARNDGPYTDEEANKYPNLST